MEVVGRVFLGCVVRLVSPVYANFLARVRNHASPCHSFNGCTAYIVVNATAIEGGHATLGRARVVILDETVVETLGVELLAVSGTRMLQQLQDKPGPRHKAVKSYAADSECYLTEGELAVLSGMILTLWTWPVVSKI